MDDKKLTDEIIISVREMRKETNHGLERINDRLNEVSVTLGIQAEQLKEHMRRSDLLEEKTSLLRKDIDLKLQSVEAQVEPLKRHVEFVSNGVKWFGVISAVVAFIASLKKAFF